MRKPKVSILMSVYNGERFVCRAIESLLQQSFRDFEFIIIDDGSADGTGEKLAGFSDRRIIRIKNGANLGLAKSLNTGLKIARGKYIARLDADDVAARERLQLQVSYLEQNPGVGIVGSYAAYETPSQRLLHRYPAGDCEICWWLLFNNAFAHPSVMFHKSLVDISGPYRDDFTYAQDYEFFVRFSRVALTANLPKALVTGTAGTHRISEQFGDRQSEFAYRVSDSQISNLLERPAGAEATRGIWALWSFSPHAADVDIGASIEESAAGVMELLEKFEFYYVRLRKYCLHESETRRQLKRLRKRVIARLHYNAAGRFIRLSRPEAARRSLVKVLANRPGLFLRPGQRRAFAGLFIKGLAQ